MADVPWLMIQPATLSSYSNALTEAISASPVLESRQVGSSISNSSSILSGQDGSDGSIPVKSESTEVQEQYVWSIDKIGKAVLELQEENKHLKQILASNGIEVNKE